MNTFSQEKKTILVTGSDGQLGKELQEISNEYLAYNFLFTNRESLPIENNDFIKKYFEKNSINYCINCAAYTAVDKAESEQEKAFLINADAPGNLAKICNEYNTQFIHISTDYVFDGTSSIPYKEENPTAPINIYGATKLKGEEAALKNNNSTIIFRTSWVYSSFGNNFVKTMLRLMNEKKNINVVDDQFGCPTYAADLGDVILKIIDRQEISGNYFTGVLNFCNTGITSWYQFALAIKNAVKSNCTINPIPSSEYKTAAKRPQYSVLDTSKIESTFQITIPDWQNALRRCLSLLS